jgi:hypothetical protein
MNTSELDVEAPDMAKAMSTFPRGRLSLEIAETAGLLLAWSLLVMVEGVIRLVTNAVPDGGLTPDTGFPPLVLLLGGVAEVAFGAVGVSFGVAVLLFRLRSSAIATAFLVFQSVLSWYVFIVFVIAFPAYVSAHLEAGRFGFSLSLDRFLIVLGILTSASWCAALQAGQFILASRLRAMFVSGKHKLDATVWCAFALIAGLAITVSGILVASKTAGSPLIPPPAYPPNVAIYPQMLIATGLITSIWACVGLAGSAGTTATLLKAFHLGWGPVFLINLITFSLVFGKVPEGKLAAPAAQHALLTFAYTSLPLVFTSKLVRSETNHEADE